MRRRIFEKGVSLVRIRLDGAELALGNDVLSEGKRAVFEAVKRDAMTRNSVIVGITVDGETIDDEEVFCALAGGLDVQFTSQPVMELVTESLGEGNRYFPLLLQGLEEIATLLEEGHEEEAKVKLLSAIEGVNWLISVFDKSCVLMSVRPAELKSGDFMKDREKLNEVLTEMLEVMEKQRILDLAFLIREKILPVIGSLALYWTELYSQTEGSRQ